MNTEEKILELIEELKPYLYMDGGNIEFVKYEDQYLFINLTGACSTCMYQDNTINDTLYNFFHSQIPEIKGIINVNL